MATEAPSWADQWGAGGFGAMQEEEHDTINKKDTETNKKGDGKAGLNKAKAAAMMGAQKIKTGATNGIKWFKTKCQKRDSTTLPK